MVWLLNDLGLPLTIGYNNEVPVGRNSSGTGEMAQWLRRLTVPAEDQSAVPSLQVRGLVTAYNSSSRGILNL